METEPHPERVREYEEVLSFIDERLSLTHRKSLFVFGACGCGKTSTVLRALRRVSHRPMACDRTPPTRVGAKRSRPSSECLSPPRPLRPAARRVQGHYVNCADLCAEELSAAVASSLRRAQPRPDAPTRALLAQLEALPRRRPETDAETPPPAALHVVALDEVEYARAAGALAALAALSAQRAAQLALIFISNQRDLVHVPRALRKALPFAAYSAAALERIGASLAVDGEWGGLSPALLAVVARKALLEHAGDVRQVAVMCRRLMHSAREEAPRSPSERRRMSAANGASPDSPPAAAGTGSPEAQKPKTTRTLAQSHGVLHPPTGVERAAEHLASMPEQMLYVLSCLVVLCLRQRRDGVAAPGTFTMRAVHQLYMALMGQRRFPAMNAAGISGAIDGFADLGILSRPQKRGNEEIFSFNGTWPLEAMQSALIARGEALRQECVECGLDAAENRFDAVIRELKTIVGI